MSNKKRLDMKVGTDILFFHTVSYPVSRIPYPVSRILYLELRLND